MALLVLPLLPAPSTGLADTEAADPGAAAPPLAVIGVEELFESDVDAVMRLRPGAFGSDPEAARELALETLMAEYLVAERYASRLSALPAEVVAALEDARRRVTFDVFARSQFMPPAPSDEDIAAFVAENPALFSERVTYRFQRFRLAAPEDAQRSVVDAALDSLSNGTASLEARAAAFLETLGTQGIRVGREMVWTGSEALGSEDRRRLAALADSGASVDMARDGDAIDVVLLFDARPDPVEPAVLRAQIEDFIVQVAFRRHREALIASLAADVRDRMAERARMRAEVAAGLARNEDGAPQSDDAARLVAGLDAPAPESSIEPVREAYAAVQPWMLAVAAFWITTSASLFGVYRWVGLVRARYGKRAREEDKPSRRPSVARAVGVGWAVASLAVSAMVLVAAALALPLRPLAALSVGCALLGIAGVAIWHRAAPFADEPLSVAVARARLTVSLQVVSIVGLAVAVL